MVSTGIKTNASSPHSPSNYNVIIRSCHTQAGFQSLNLSIAYVGPIQMGDQTAFAMSEMYSKQP